MWRPAKGDMAVSCATCGVVVVVPRRKSGRRFCSLRCAGMSRRKRCTVAGCLRKYASSGYCRMHLKRVKVHGDANVAATLRKGMCLRCGRAFTFVRQAVANYCSSGCRNAARTASIPISVMPCERCGAQVPAKAYSPRRKFCQTCRFEIAVAHRSGTSLCRECGESFITPNPHQCVCPSCARRRRLRAIVLRNQRRKALRRGALGPTHTEAEWKALVERYGGVCAYCRCRPVECRDHVVPVSRGGSDSIGNILPSCQLCNTQKGTLSLDAWREKFTETYGDAW